MPRVIDDINKYKGELPSFHIYNIDKVYAIRFENAYSHDDVLRIISRLEQETSGLVRTEVSLVDERIDGTHAYYIRLLNGIELNIPIW